MRFCGLVLLSALLMYYISIGVERILLWRRKRSMFGYLDAIHAACEKAKAEQADRDAKVRANTYFIVKGVHINTYAEAVQYSREHGDATIEVHQIEEGE